MVKFNSMENIQMKKKILSAAASAVVAAAAAALLLPAMVLGRPGALPLLPAPATARRTLVAQKVKLTN